ncbi:MAG: HipA domain-containing protein [Arthrobacter sp.]|nr:HipA domain-containing protein [Micrococcaceae bacterium]MDN6169356.1 HipA domain-containing protein [Micrococcaceae bacterium]MDN6177074.1 HipA domain-containing protein [Micrococcaceae bacterium]
MAVLKVFLDGTLAGELRQAPSGNLTFHYDSGYQKLPHATPLSLSMPLAFADHPKRTTLPFFEGLLTDNQTARRAMASRFGANAKTPFALLQHMGADVAGALQILPPGQRPSDGGSGYGMDTLETVDVERELQSVLEEYRDGHAPGARMGRFSLAGAQAKTALCRTPDGRWAAPRGAMPSTHILKPVAGDFRRIDIVEHLTMQAATHLGLNVAETWLENFGVVRAFVTTRYDRSEEGGVWRRLHQEDLCQALSVLPEKKYQREDGGPGVAEAARLFAGLPVAEDRTAAAAAFYQWLVFNITLECTDAHAKNFALMLDADRVRASPLYDLATFAPYRAEGSTTHSAMKVGGEYRFQAISPVKLAAAAKTLRLDPHWAENEVERQRLGALQAFSRARDELVAADDSATDFADHVLDKVAGIERLGWA